MVLLINLLGGKKWSLEKCGQQYKSNKYQNHTSNKFSWSDTTEKCQLFKNSQNKCKKNNNSKKHKTQPATKRNTLVFNSHPNIKVTGKGRRAANMGTARPKSGSTPPFTDDVRGQIDSFPSRQTVWQSHPHKWLASRKIWSVEELETLPAGTQPRPSHHRLPGGQRRGKRKRYTILLERTREGHRQSDEHWNYFKGKFGETSERWRGEHVGFSKHIDTILCWTELNWTELNCWVAKAWQWLKHAALVIQWNLVPWVQLPIETWWGFVFFLLLLFLQHLRRLLSTYLTLVRTASTYIFAHVKDPTSTFR